jgi:hypothetical protein
MVKLAVLSKDKPWHNRRILKLITIVLCEVGQCSVVVGLVPVSKKAVQELLCRLKLLIT